MRTLQVKESDPDFLEPQRCKQHVWEWRKFFLEMYYDKDFTKTIAFNNRHVFKESFNLVLQEKWNIISKRQEGLVEMANLP